MVKRDRIYLNRTGLFYVIQTLVVLGMGSAVFLFVMATFELNDALRQGVRLSLGLWYWLPLFIFGAFLYLAHFLQHRGLLARTAAVAAGPVVPDDDEDQADDDEDEADAAAFQRDAGSPTSDAVLTMGRTCRCSVRGARSQQRHPLQYMADAARFRLTADRVFAVETSYEPATMPDGTVIYLGSSSERRGWNRFLMRLWVRAVLERSWNRHFRDVIRMHVPELPYGPAAMDLGTLPLGSRCGSMGIVRAWHRVAASRTLEKIGVALLGATLKTGADLPAQNLAAELLLPYDLNISRGRRPARTAALMWRAYRGFASRSSATTSRSEQEEAA